jgi:hypothetical protein
MVFKIFKFPPSRNTAHSWDLQIGYFKNHAEHLNVVSGDNIEFFNAESYRTYRSTVL